MDSKGKAPVSPRNAPYHEHQDSDSDSSSDIEEDARLLIDTYLPPLHPSTATEKARFLPPPLYSELPGSTSTLPLPLCIPQTGTTATAPFVRAYNPEIGISVEEFMGFVDGLNLAMTSSPPLRIVDVAGQIIGFVYVFSHVPLLYVNEKQMLIGNTGHTIGPCGQELRCKLQRRQR